MGTSFHCEAKASRFQYFPFPIFDLEELRNVVREALQECGGRATASEIFEVIQSKYPNHFHKDSVSRVLQQNNSIFFKLGDQNKRNSPWILVESSVDNSAVRNAE